MAAGPSSLEGMTMVSILDELTVLEAPGPRAGARPIEAGRGAAFDVIRTARG